MKLKHSFSIWLLLFIPFMTNGAAELYQVNTVEVSLVEQGIFKIKKIKRKVKRLLKTNSEYSFPLYVILGGCIVFALSMLLTSPVLLWFGIFGGIMGGILLVARFLKQNPMLKFPFALIVLGTLMLLFSSILSSPIIVLIFFFGGFLVGGIGVIFFIKRLFKYVL